MRRRGRPADEEDRATAVARLEALRARLPEPDDHLLASVASRPRDTGETQTETLARMVALAARLAVHGDST